MIHLVKQTPSWAVILEVKKDLVGDLRKEMFMQSRDSIPIYAEPQLGQILAYRNGVIDGVEKFFILLDKLEQSFKNEKEKS